MSNLSAVGLLAPMGGAWESSDPRRPIPGLAALRECSDPGDAVPFQKIIELAAGAKVLSIAASRGGEGELQPLAGPPSQSCRGLAPVFILF